MKALPTVDISCHPHPVWALGKHSGFVNGLVIVFVFAFVISFVSTFVLVFVSAFVTVFVSGGDISCHPHPVWASQAFKPVADISER